MRARAVSVGLALLLVGCAARQVPTVPPTVTHHPHHHARPDAAPPERAPDIDGRLRDIERQVRTLRDSVASQ